LSGRHHHSYRRCRSPGWTGAVRGANIAAPNAPVDEAVIAELRNQIDDEDGAAIAHLIEDYLEESAESVHELRLAVTVNDIFQVLKLTHSWKSTSVIFGATQLAALLGQAEGAAIRAPDELAALTAQIEHEHERVAASLRRLRHRIRPEQGADR